MSIAYLRTHSYYSLKRALPSPEELVGAAAAGGLQALALTDHGALIGAVGFRALCDEAGVQPIIGLVVPVAVELMRELARDELVLLARNPAGYRSLARLSTTLQAAPERERWQQHGLPWSEIQMAADGVICLTGGQRGILWSLAAAGDRPGSTRYLSRLGGTFAENAYLSLELHRPEDAAIATEIEQLGSRFGLATVAVQPVYQMKPAQRERLRLLAAIDHNCSLEEVPAAALAHRERAEVDYSWQTPDALAARFAAFPEALARTGAIATQCMDALPDGRPIWPALNLPAGQSPQDRLAAAATSGLARRYPPAPTPAAQTRLQHELTAIGRFGYDPLFLILADVVRFAREQQIPVSTRGSVANSLVAYCLGITTVDPLHHDLLFERFLNPARQSMPDIDLDFCSRRRDEILAYIRATYGEDKVALVSTINTFQPRSALRETAKAYGIDPEKIERWTKNLPRWWHPDPERREKPLIETVADGSETARERLAIEAAAELVGLPSHLGLHPGGVVVAPGAMTDYAPLHLSPKGYLATQFDHWDVERLGLVKIDILGIRALTVVDKTLALLRRRGIEVDLAAIPDGDEATGRMLATGGTIGVFQAESTGAMRTLRQLKARDVTDLAVANAFFKPGPATGGMAANFVRRYRGQEKVQYLHPALEPILAKSKGVLLFQEQVLRVAVEVAGLSWAEADQIRQGMSKFQAEKINQLTERFVSGAQEKNGLTEAQARQLWGQIEAFSGYGFNQGHATAYAAVSYQMAYLKQHYPAEFICARLSEAGGFHHPAIYMAEARRLGMRVRPPHINVSKGAFTLTEEAGQPQLWLGLRWIRDLRRASARAIEAARPFQTLAELLERVSLQVKELEHLIQCGALDGLGESRAALLAEARAFARAGSTHQLSLFPMAETITVAAESAADRLGWENRLLGWPISLTPLELVNVPEEAVGLRRWTARGGDRPVRLAGYRLPGYTGGKGFYFSDGDDYLLVRSDEKLRLTTWQPVLLEGRWREDSWGGGWLLATAVTELD